MYEMQSQRNMVGGIFHAVEDAVQLKKENGEMMKNLTDKEERTLNLLDKISRALVVIYKSIPGPIPIPKIFKVMGKVEITDSVPIEIKNLINFEKYLKSVEENLKKLSTVKFPSFPNSIEVENFDEMGAYFKMLNDRISSLATAISQIPQAKIEIPKIDFPKTKDAKADPKMMELLEEIANGLKKIKTPKMEFPESIAVSNFPPQMIPQPVTNININALRGIVHTTAATVTNSLTPLPTYGVLPNRRSVIIYNNSSSNTVFIGGSDVSDTNGLPITANTFSPSIDAGINMVVYGVTTSSTADVRVMEVSNDNIGT